MMDQNLILHLPFDDPDGGKAYDYSASRADATLSNGADFSREAARGKSLNLHAVGECQTNQGIPFDSDFTVSFFVRTTSEKLGWLLNCDGINNFVEQWLDMEHDKWIFMAFVKQDSFFTVYQDMTVVYKKTLSDTPIGFSLNNASLMEISAQLDELQVWSRALTAKELIGIQKGTDVEYYIDGRNLKEFGVYITKSKGLTDRLKRKDTLHVEWDNYHGTVRDKRRPRFESRQITLECMLEASSRSAFVEWQRLFFDQFDQEGTHRLTIEYNGNVKPLVYEVELLDNVDVEKTWGTYHDDIMVGTFTIKLVEDEPVKKVLRHISKTADSQASITVSSNKLLNIYWGDGTHTYSISGKDQIVTHTYTQAGSYDIIVAGVIEDIEKFETNAIVVWSILK